MGTRRIAFPYNPRQVSNFLVASENRHGWASWLSMWSRQPHKTTRYHPLDHLDLVCFIPTLALTVRRMHQANLSGWMSPILFVPFVGTLAAVLMLCPACPLNGKTAL